VVGFASGRIPEISANRILLKNIAITGVHWSAYPERDPRATRVSGGHRRQHGARGELRPLVSERHPLERAGEAVAAVAAGRTTGKIVVLPRLSV
jgi:NADPH:quinone reductase